MKKIGTIFAFCCAMSAQSNAASLIEHCEVMSGKLAAQAELLYWSYNDGWKIDKNKSKADQADFTAAIAYGMTKSELSREHPLMHTWSTISLTNAWIIGYTPDELSQSAFKLCVKANS